MTRRLGSGLGLLVALASSSLSAEPLRAAATIFPLYDVLRQIGGPAVEPVLVLPPGASPHTFDPRPSSARAIARSAVLFRIGHGLDDWAARLAEASGVSRVVAVDAGIRLRTLPGGGADPHYWLSADNAKAIAHSVAVELGRIAPAELPGFEARLRAYVARLDAADAEIRKILKGLPSRSVATLHDGFGYFAQAYGLSVAAVFEPSGGREPGPRAVAEFQQRVRAAGVQAIFVEPQLSRDAIGPIAGDLGLPIVTLDDLGGVAGRASLIDLLLFDAHQVASAMKPLRVSRLELRVQV